MRYVRILLLCIFCLAGTALATQPDCTGDRHLDECGQNCPEPTICEPVLPCPDPAPCQPVVCQDGNDGTTTVVTVDRCPEPEVAEVCKVRRNGEVVCPRSKRARRNGNGGRRIIVPRSIIEKVAG